MRGLEGAKDAEVSALTKRAQKLACIIRVSGILTSVTMECIIGGGIVTKAVGGKGSGDF